MESDDILIIGAGMAGIACARALVAAGRTVRLIDKGRGIGGRVATRRADGELSFDHGAQYVTAKGPDFAHALGVANRACAPWPDPETGKPRVVGQPGMSSLPKALADGLTVTRASRVAQISNDGGTKRVRLVDGSETTARSIVMTVPAPQIPPLLRDDHPLLPQIAHVRMDPCLTLMAATQAKTPFQIRADPDAPLSWIALNSAKPGREAPGAWVAQAGPDWSRQHLELDPDELRAAMLPLVCEAIGAEPSQITHIDSHRWRYARVDVPLGQPFLHHDGLYLGGDWCIGARVEAAWDSGTAIARAILEGQS